MARFSSSGLCALLFVGLCLCGTVSGAMNLSSRQSSGRQSEPGSTSLVAASSASVGSLRRILLPALQSLLVAPLQLLRQLAMELSNYIRSHSLSDLYSMKTIQMLAARLPDRVSTYWVMITEMESQCMQRTLCDLADFAALRLPKWAQQIVLVYLNAFSSVHPYYQVAINGLTTHQCKAVYADCDAQQFLARVRGNLTETLATTMAPVKEAFEELVTATTGTLNSLAMGDDEARPSAPIPAQPRPRPMEAPIEEEEASFNDQFSRAGPNLPSRAQPFNDQFMRTRPQGPFPRH